MNENNNHMNENLTKDNSDSNNGLKMVDDFIDSVDLSKDIVDLLDIDKFINGLKTGDIILFNGVKYWISYFIELFTRSEISHVGMVLKDPTYIHPSLKGYYMLESGEENFPDAVEHKIKFGVQIVNLRKVIEGYQGKIFFRKLKITDDNKEKQRKIETTLADTWIKIKDLPYDDYPWDVVRVIFGIQCGDLKRTKTFFCSALLTFLLDQFQFFNSPICWDTIIPEHYNDKGKIEGLLKNNISFSSKVEIK